MAETDKRHKIPKERLDKLLVERGLVESRTRAQALIMAGKVKVNGERVDKAGAPTGQDCVLEVDEGQRWASRGAFKLLKALDVFQLEVAGRVCVDIGASTGGFTDVLLSAGAKKVYAVDVGYGQLHSRLAHDPRVVVMDRTNARTLTPDRLGRGSVDDRVALAVCDASFISLRLLLPAMDSILSQEGEAVVLIKPQFEAGRERLGRGGVVRDPAVHAAVLREVRDFALRETRLRPVGLSWSPILGPEGNREFLCLLTRDAGAAIVADAIVEAAVKAAHEELL
ncbi:MAG: TlyA family RNA methyltransferase [Synergistaceae bacterium]|nr:TlyA family RNA methyltransferase [Synergistaceae bacterium]